jgi:hypothetical protein
MGEFNNHSHIFKDSVPCTVLYRHAKVRLNYQATKPPKKNSVCITHLSRADSKFGTQNRERQETSRPQFSVKLECTVAKQHCFAQLLQLLWKGIFGAKQSSISRGSRGSLHQPSTTVLCCSLNRSEHRAECLGYLPFLWVIFSRFNFRGQRHCCNYLLRKSETSAAVQCAQWKKFVAILSHT